MKRILVLAAALGLTACASSQPDNGGPRPPEGPGRAGINFGYWNRDAEGSVDQAFRTFIVARYPAADLAKARKDLEADGFKCIDGNRPDGRPVPNLECTRLYKGGEDVHAWTVEFWPQEVRPKARYTRTHIRNPMKNYDSSPKRS